MEHNEKGFEPFNIGNDNTNNPLSIDDQLAQYSDAEKSKAFQKLDYHLILLFVLLSSFYRVIHANTTLAAKASAFFTCYRILTVVMLEILTLQAWEKNGASHQINTLG
jgi:hypothetical protein